MYFIIIIIIVYFPLQTTGLQTFQYLEFLKSISAVETYVYIQSASTSHAAANVPTAK